MKFAYLFLLGIIFINGALSAENKKISIPADVENIIKRKSGCGHWSGEEGYDEDRKKEIGNALKVLKCSTLEVDLNKLLMKYRKNKSILKAIEDASSDG